MRVNGLAALVAVALGGAVAPMSGVALAETSGTALAAAQCSPGGPDFDGDGCADLVVADPDATVSGTSRAGRINVLYGAESGAGVRSLLFQGQPGVAGSPEADDRFGAAVRAARINNDPYTDLVVATPTEDVGSANDAGIIQVIFGSAEGLGGGAPSLTVRQGLHGVPGTPEAGDRFGAGLAVNTTTGESWPAPAVAYGAPGEDIGSTSNAGAAGLVAFDPATGTVSAARAITQDSPGIAGSVEAGDRFGAAVEVFQGPGGFFCDVTGAKGFTLVVGTPGEDFGAVRDVGMVHLARDLAKDTPLSQDAPGVGGVGEAGDQFGASLALTSFCEHDGPSHVTLAVGVPAEDIGSTRDAGAAHLFRTDDDELPLPERWSASQNTTGVAGTAEAGDRFGSLVALGGPWRDDIGEPVVVGVAGEDIGAAGDAGAVQVFGDATSDPGNGDVFVSQAHAGESPEAGDHFGAAVTTRGDYLYVGAPDDVTYSSGAVHGILWPSLFGPEGHQFFVPGVDGVPADATRFGAALA
ncbi:MAG: hypothetical protein GEU94_05200 [Micromonosporaceae bacterium]|nr:hypothetical protein [Micromonosporaceae bacterium]